MSERDQIKLEDSEEPKDQDVQPDAAIAAPPPASGEVAMEPELQAFIGRQLQATYDEVLNEPVPDRFLELLQKLEKSNEGEP